MDLNLDGEGFLMNRDDWTPEVAREIAALDSRELTDEHMGYIVAARKMFDTDGVVPPLRKFCKAQDASKADMFASFESGPMKLICKWGGLPKPTGCV
ncbi:MAG: TusE/DsrC/DsvC family sulfur relay protein [Alphaproteobacteria bacterium]